MNVVSMCIIVPSPTFFYRIPRRNRIPLHLLHHCHEYSCNSSYTIPPSRGFPRTVGNPEMLRPTSGSRPLRSRRQITRVGVQPHTGA